MSGLYTEADYENSVIELFRNDLGYEYVYGPDIERDFYNPLYEDVLLDSLYRLNRGLPDDAIQDALFKLKNFENLENNPDCKNMGDHCSWRIIFPCKWIEGRMVYVL